MTKGIAYFFAVLVYGIGAGSANGDAIYNYTGSHFTTVTGSAPAGITAAFITASFTFASPLGPNLSDANEILLSWSISDQIDAITSADPTAFVIQSAFSTDPTGKIVPTTSFSVAAISDGQEIDMEIFNPGGDAVRLSQVSGPNAVVIYQALTTQTGIYTLTPEPTTATLGLLAVVVAVLGIRWLQLIRQP